MIKRADCADAGERAAPPALFLFAHQDDEFGAFHELQRHIRSGRHVVVVYLTSGRSDGGRAAVRDSESRLVLRQLGLEDGDMHFLGADIGVPDGRLHQHLWRAFDALRVIVADAGQSPSGLYFPAWEGGHQDHDATHLLGLALAREHDLVRGAYQFPLYQGAGLPGSLFRVFAPLAENGGSRSSSIEWRERVRYLRFCLSYPSQRRTWLGLFPFVLAHYCLYGTQILQEVSFTRAALRPHPGRLLYERRGFCKYEEFVSASCDFVKRMLSEQGAVLPVDATRMPGPCDSKAA